MAFYSPSFLAYCAKKTSKTFAGVSSLESVPACKVRTLAQIRVLLIGYHLLSKRVKLVTPIHCDSLGEDFTEF
jgi:hypothetical protein